MGVFLAYAGARGYTLLDAELYLPEGWTNEPARLQEVGLAPDMPFATKPQLAQRLLAQAQAAGVSLAWVVGDIWPLLVCARRRLCYGFPRKTG